MIRNLYRLPGLCLGRLTCDAIPLIIWLPEYQNTLYLKALMRSGEWLYSIEKALVPFNRFVDFSRLTSLAVRTNHVFAFAHKRAEQYAGLTPVKSALFSEDWVCFGIALHVRKSNEGNADPCARYFSTAQRQPSGWACLRRF